LSAMALAIFFVKYRIEYIFVLPAIAVLFGKYFLPPASGTARATAALRRRLANLACIPIFRNTSLGEEGSRSVRRDLARTR
jgi:hypothetical protein